MFFADSLNNLNTYVLVAVALVVGLFTLVRGRADVWQSNYEGEKERADNLQKELTRAKERVAQLESQPDVERLYALMENHDKNTVKTNDKLAKVLDAIAEKIK